MQSLLTRPLIPQTQNSLPLASDTLTALAIHRNASLDLVNAAPEFLARQLQKNIISNHRNWQLDLDNLRGQAYDGAGARAGATKGAAARILQLYPKALFTHCAAHKLILCVVKCCSVLEVSNAMEFADSIVRFFDNSPKRQSFLEIFIEGEGKKKLKELCRTRWVERHDAFEVFIQLYKPLANCIQALSTAPVEQGNL